MCSLAAPHPTSDFPLDLQGFPPATTVRLSLRSGAGTLLPILTASGFSLRCGSVVAGLHQDPFPSCPWPLQGVSLTLRRSPLPAPATRVFCSAGLHQRTETSAVSSARIVSEPLLIQLDPPGRLALQGVPLTQSVTPLLPAGCPLSVLTACGLCSLSQSAFVGLHQPPPLLGFWPGISPGPSVTLLRFNRSSFHQYTKKGL